MFKFLIAVLVAMQIAIPIAVARQSIVNSDVRAAAEINRSKIENGTADHVVINDGGGALSSEAQLSITRGGTGSGTALGGFNALSPLTTKGDLLTIDSGNNIRKAIGSDGFVLTADASTSGGIKWAQPVQGSSSTPTDIASAGSAGSNSTYSKSDHTHRGVLSLSKNGSSALYGSVTLTAGTGISLTQSGQDISIAASAGSGSSQENFSINGNVSLLSSGLPITFIDGVRRVESSKTITKIVVCASNSGSGTTTVRIRYGTSSLSSNTTVNLTGTAGLSCNDSGAISLSVNSGEYVVADLTAVGTDVADLSIAVLY